MQAERILIGCSVKSKNADFANIETEYLFKTLLEFGGKIGNAKKIACFTEEPDSSIKEILENLQVQIRIVEPVDNRQSFGNKIRILDEGIKEDVDVIVMLDTDIVIAGDFSQFLGTQKIMIKQEDSDPFTLSDWKQMFDFFKLPLPQERFQTSCSGQETIPYFNGGVMIIPKLHASELLEQWKYFLKQLLDKQNNLPPKFSENPHDNKQPRFFDQIAFSLAITKSKLPYEILPLSMNYPYSGTVHHSEHPETLEPFIIHHHHCILENGELMLSPYRLINNKIDTINLFLEENRESKIEIKLDDSLVIRNLTQEHEFWEVLDRLEDLPIDSDNASLQYYLALSLHHTHSTARIDEAIVRYNTAFENGFDKFMVHSDRGFLHHLAGDMKNARKDLLLAYELKPYDLENRRRLALTDSRIPMLKELHSKLKFKETIEKIGDLSLDDENAYLHYYLGSALYRTGKDLDKALLHYNKALEYGMSDFWFHLSRAGLHAHLGMIDEFKTDFQIGYGKLVDYYEGTEPHIDYLRTLIWKKDAGLKKLRELNVKKDAGLKKLRRLNTGKDADIENLRSIINEMRDSPSWKLVKKFGLVKKKDSPT